MRNDQIRTAVTTTGLVAQFVTLASAINVRPILAVISRCPWRSVDPHRHLVEFFAIDCGPQRRRRLVLDERVSRDLDLWAYRHDVTLDFSWPGKPADNAFIEAFNGRTRAACLKTRCLVARIRPRKAGALALALQRANTTRRDRKQNLDYAAESPGRNQPDRAIRARIF
jgi:hypothetical protein